MEFLMPFLHANTFTGTGRRYPHNGPTQNANLMVVRLIHLWNEQLSILLHIFSGQVKHCLAEGCFLSSALG
jgi:hypothetical protein